MLLLGQKAFYANQKNPFVFYLYIVYCVWLAGYYLFDTDIHSEFALHDQQQTQPCLGHLTDVKKPAEHIELTQEQIIHKLETFCSYRERCTSEINQKLYQLQVEKNDFDFYINYLKENNFLNETRYANSFARGKNAIKKWGRKKIVMELKFRQIDESTVQQSLLQIDEGMYLIKLQDVLEKKNRIIKETDPFKRKQKLIQFAMQKGYEYEIINEALKNMAT